MIGVVLAGGRSRRMGRDKAQLALGGRTFLDHVGSALRAVFAEVLIVGADEPHPWPGVADEGASHRGPLSGVVTGLRHAETDVCAIAVDHPLARPETIRHLADLADGRPVVPVHDGHPQVTFALYPLSALPALSASLDEGGFIRRALDSLDVRWVEEDEWRTWGEEGTSWRSVDTPEALADLRSIKDLDMNPDKIPD